MQGHIFGDVASSQLTTAGATALTYDPRGNLTASGGAAYSYTSENRLAGTGSIQLQYEITGNRLLQMYNTATGLDMRFGWSGDQMISEMNAAGWAIVRRYVPGPGTDEPVVW